jgi:hypothetical protein
MSNAKSTLSASISALEVCTSPSARCMNQ